MMVSLKSYLIEKLQEELPGKKAHLELAPSRRATFTSLELNEARKSGVLILFYEKDGVPYIVLMQRPEYNGTHSGQVSFPGGKQEETDRDIEHTALREANEEVGVVEKDIEVLGQLTEVYIPVSKFNVTPIIGFIDYHPEFKLDHREVAELIELRLSDLTETVNFVTSRIRLVNNTILKAPSFVFEEKVVWGATALMLNELRHILKGWSS